MIKRTSLAIALVAAFGISTAAVSSVRQAAFASDAVDATSTLANIILARADDPPGDLRHGRGRDDGIGHKRQGADDPPGDLRHGRGRDDGIGHKRQGADDPPGDLRHGRGRDDGIGHKRGGADDPVGDDRRGRGRDDGLNHG